MDLLQDSPNHNYNRKTHLQASHFNPYANYYQGNAYNSTSYDSFDQGDYPNLSKKNKTRNSYPEDMKKSLPQKNQSYPNISNKIGVISSITNDLQKELDNLTTTNNSLLAEIEKIEISHSDLIANKIILVEEAIEKKTNLILLKKEVEVKRGYLNSMIRIKKTQIEENQKSKINRFIKQIKNMNDSTEILNEAAAQLNNLHGLNLKFLDDINQEILVNLIKNRK